MTEQRTLVSETITDDSAEHREALRVNDGPELPHTDEESKAAVGVGVVGAVIGAVVGGPVGAVVGGALGAATGATAAAIDRKANEETVVVTREVRRS